MRIAPNIIIHRTVRNRSSRGGKKPRAIVLHSTESHNRPGDADLAAIVAWFDNPAAQASSHVITDSDGTSARCVPDKEKAWTCAAYNAVTLNIEQIGFASQQRWASAELSETARWIAQWSRKWNIPIRRGIAVGGVIVRKGVVTHKQLGPLGGNHNDPGEAYPLRKVLRRAREFKRARQS